jgi:hypothetical protein
MHEIGHNLGHHHSGKGGINYADPTCNMGNVGTWSDIGSNFCFNAAKTWANKWYEDYHGNVDPSIGSYDGNLVGINAVKEGTIVSGQNVVLKIKSPVETDLYVMFNRKVGANNGVPSYGDQVVITEQSAELYEISSWTAALSKGETYVKSNWSSSGTLTIKVCSLETGSPGSARILVYATEQETLSCDVDVDETPQPPTAGPQKGSCQDEPDKFDFSSGTIDTRRPCKFVAKRKTERCAIKAAAEYCPVTCGSNCVAYDTPGMFTMPNGRRRRCSWVLQKPDKFEKRCRINAIRSNCPIVCGVKSHSIIPTGNIFVNLYNTN